MKKTPEIDERDFERIVEELKALAPYYVSEFEVSEDKGAGIALIKIFANMLKIVIDRLNRVPEKNFAAFLDMLGIQLLPAQPSRAPVTFYLSEGAKKSVLIPERSQASAEEIVFETEKNIVGTPSKLVKAYSISVDKDEIFASPPNVVSGEITAPFSTTLTFDVMGGEKKLFLDGISGLKKEDVIKIEDKRIEYAGVSEVSETKVDIMDKLLNNYDKGTVVSKVTTFELFEGKNRQEHILYLGHKDRFNIRRKAEIKLEIAALHMDKLEDDHSVMWEYYACKDPDTKEDIWERFESIKVVGSFLILTKDSVAEIKENEIDEIKSRWIRCKVKKCKIPDVEEIAIDTIKIGGQQGGILPDMVFYNDVPLDLTLALYPFGKKPRIFDTFYIGCSDTFSKKGASITLTFSLTHEYEYDIPVIRINGVGPKFEGMLKAANIYTTEELLKYTSQQLVAILETNKIKTVVNILEAAKKAFYDKTLQNKKEDKKEELYSQDRQEELTLSWEYWNGVGWIVIENLDDKTDRFLEHGERAVTFTCPSNTEISKVNGQENYWVRVRIISGDYGKELDYDGENWVPGQINPPLISKITIGYELEKTTNLEHCLTYNNLEFKDVTEESKTEKTLFKPFQPLADKHQTLYLGFDGKIEKGLSIFFSLEEQEFIVKIMPKITWRYYSQEKKWVRLEGLDDTRNLTRTGTVEFIVPADFAKTSKFGDELYWINAVDIEDKFRTQSAAKVKGIYLNTTFAIQAESIKDELLGSSDGSADQKFQFTRFPIIKEKEEIWVNETGTLLEEEKKAIIEEKGEDYVSESKDETWVRWQAVEDFFDSTSKSRHYGVDRATGEVRFGDGESGMVPPIGRDNIKANYQVGGGERGNVGASEISTMKTSIPFMARVTNPGDAGGGADIEILEDAMERGPWVVKHRNRAVTVEDFEWLARQASRDVARVKCTRNINESGSVKVIIVPESEEDKPSPSLELKNVVEKYLLDHCSNVVSLQVKGPEYIEVFVIADVYPRSIDAAPIAEKEALKRLKEFLHPLTGGENGKGWEFERLICQSDIYALLEGITEIDHVENVTVRMVRAEEGERTIVPPETWIPSGLICSGEHQINMKFKGAI